MCPVSLKQMVSFLVVSHLGVVTYSVFPRTQQITLFDQELCDSIDTRPALQVRVPYNIYSGILYQLVCILMSSDPALNATFITEYRENNYNKDMEMSSLV